jgi:hypothetical protein
MPRPKRLRLPLATGASSLASLALPSGVLQLLAFGPLLVATKLPGWTVYPIALLWALWFFVVIGSLVVGWKRRASDVVIEDGEIRVHGGPRHGLRLAFATIDPARCGLEEQRETEDGPPHTVLVLGGEEVAQSEDPAEIRSFSALVDTVRAIAARRDAPASAPRPPEDAVLACASCGAPQPPRDAETAPCRHCGAAVPMPAEVRATLADLGRADGHRAASERMLATLLRQPGARTTSLLFALGVPPVLFTWPLCTIAYDELFQTRHTLSFAQGVALAVAGLAGSYGLAVLLQAELVGRAALRLVALDFGARPPAREGDPEACRHCGGPLPEIEGAVVVACAFCRAENLTGTDLAPRARAEEDQATSLEATLRDRLAARRKLRWLSLAAIVALAAGGGSLWRTFHGPCADGVRDGDETDVDCGGSCRRCDPERACKDDGDCRSGRCMRGACAAPRCDDGLYNGDESSTDCGGSCPPCADGMNCRDAKDCASGRCSGTGECEANR